jgi:threonine dehydratase
VLRTTIPDRPGELMKLLNLIAEARGNVVSVEHHREGLALSVSETEVELTLVTRDREHCDTLLAAMSAAGYKPQRLS